MTRILHSLDELNRFLKKDTHSGVYLVTSSTLAKKLAWATKKLRLGKDRVIAIPDGEKAKTWEELEKLLAAFRDRGVDRDAIILALGGGSVGDIVGFAASIYLRGIRYIQIPTTLLAQADSAHGGKTGINFKGYKNQLGTTYAPEAVVIEQKFLQSLGKEGVIDGLGEIIKAGLIKDPSILSLLEKEKASTLLGSRHLPELLKKTIGVKEWYTRKDPQERTIRRMLNFGHTIGHAIENTHRISHGRAVIHGIAEELRIGEALGYTHPDVGRRYISLLQTLGISLDASLVPDKKAILADKKISGKELNLPIVERAGKSKVVRVPVLRFTTYL